MLFAQSKSLPYLKKPFFTDDGIWSPDGFATVRPYGKNILRQGPYPPCMKPQRKSCL